MIREDAFKNHPFSSLMSLAGIRTEEINSKSIRPQHPDIVDEYGDRFALQMSRLGNRVTDRFGDLLNKTVILSMMRGGAYTGLDLAAFIKAKTHVDVPVVGVRPIYQGESGLHKTNAWLTTRELREKYPKATNYLLIDGWVGTGDSIRATRAMLDLAFKDIYPSNKITISTLSPIDPIGVCELSLRTDMVNPYCVEGNDSLGIRKPRVINETPVLAINTGVDVDEVLRPIEDMKRRLFLGPSPYYINPRPNDNIQLGLEKLKFGLGINEAISRSRGGHIIIAAPSIIPLLDKLGLGHIRGPESFPFNWLAVSVPKDKLTKL